MNDGSQDNSEKIIKDFILNKKNFKYYKKKNGGLSSARNYGLKYISGDYLLFIDGDDYINKDLLKELSKEIDKTILKPGDTEDFYNLLIIEIFE